MEVTVFYLLMQQKHNGSQLKAKYSEIEPDILSLGWVIFQKILKSVI